MSEELMLMPCPNDCKHGLVNVFEYPSGNLEESRDLYQVACACGVRGPMKDSRKAAVAAWNALPRRLQWTGAPPTKKGWYWFRLFKGKKRIVYIDMKPDCGGFNDEGNCDDMPAISEWAGPIPEPEE